MVQPTWKICQSQNRSFFHVGVKIKKCFKPPPSLIFCCLLLVKLHFLFLHFWTHVLFQFLHDIIAICFFKCFCWMLSIAQAYFWFTSQQSGIISTRIQGENGKTLWNQHLVVVFVNCFSQIYMARIQLFSECPLFFFYDPKETYQDSAKSLVHGGGLLITICWHNQQIIMEELWISLVSTHAIHVLHTCLYTFTININQM